MQVFVTRADLTADPAPESVRVMATYADSPTVPTSQHGDPAMITVLMLPAEMVITTTQEVAPNVLLPVTALAEDWRAHAELIINGEANRRIEEVFPDYKQRNSTAAYQQCVTAYGSDPTAWPTEAKTFKNEYDRGWAYVNAIRERTTVLIPDMPPDPTADTYWPTRIAPVHFDPIF